ncbi:hypothetical protein [Cetobacterium sp.]|uniref:hypothetical protein n=2 Tax=Cetobacterium sp. TaxID=2071632 RepID=UPI003EE6B45D
MYTTNINILKILYQTEISKNNLALNLNLTNGCLMKAIKQINIYLEDFKINSRIFINDDIISLELSKKEWKLIFYNLNELSNQDKFDYLYIKFIYFGFINLEKEKEILNISRSSISRYFFNIKKLLDTNNSKIIYNNGKGSKIISLSEYNKNLFVIKVMKLFLHEEILIKSQKDLLNSLKTFETKIRFSTLLAIHNSLKLPTTIYLLCFLCSVEIYTKKFGTFHNTKFKESTSIDIKTIKKTIDVLGYDFSSIYKKELYNFIADIASNKHYYIENILILSKKIIKDLLKEFSLTQDLSPILLQRIYIGIFKKENNILKIRNVYFHGYDKLIFNKLDKILKKHKIELYMCDKHIITTDIKKEYLKIKILEIKKILIILNDTCTLKQINLKSELVHIYPHIHFDIEYNFFNNKTSKRKNYDFCINDSRLTLCKGNLIDRIRQQIERKIIKNIMDKNSN